MIIFALLSLSLYNTEENYNVVTKIAAAAAAAAAAVAVVFAGLSAPPEPTSFHV